MKHGIRMKIFLPVLLLLIAFPLASWLIFKNTAGDYMDSGARKELNKLADEIAPLLTSLSASGSASDDNWPDQVAELLKDVKNHLKSGDSQADMMIFSSRPKLTYPKPTNLPAGSAGLYDYCLDILEKDKSAQALLAGKTVTINQTRYLTELLELPGDTAVRAKYFIAYIAIPDDGPLLAAAGRLVLLITAALALLSGIIVWIMARNMEKPLKLLCSHMKQIGRKEFAPLEVPFSIRELEEVKCAINDMSSQLADADKIQTTFFQNVSHELRTPLMSICGYAQGIEQNIFPDSAKAAHIITDESLRLKELVDSILTISKLDSHHLELSCCSICLNEFTEELAGRLEGMAAVKNKSIICRLPKQDIFIRADADLLLHALSNVVSNAVCYAASTVIIGLDICGNVPVFTVTDDGPGISPDDLPHIFQRFYRGKNGNFGLGLSLVKSYMEYTGGSVSVSTSSAGTVFTLTLPAEEQPLSDT